jgi:hypothetical protein
MTQTAAKTPEREREKKKKKRKQENRKNHHFCQTRLAKKEEKAPWFLTTLLKTSINY